MRLSSNLNLRTALSKCVIYDTVIQHGLYRTVNTFKTIITQNNDNQEFVSENEEKWIKSFIKLRISLEGRHKQMVNRRQESYDRVDALLDLIDNDNWNLNAIAFTDNNNSTIFI